MNALNLYQDLSHQNIELYIEQGKLKARGLLTDNQCNLIAANKEELIELLKGVDCVGCAHYSEFSPYSVMINGLKVHDIDFCNQYEGLIVAKVKVACPNFSEK